MYSLCVIVVILTSGSALIQKVEDDYYVELGMNPEYPAESCREIYNKNSVGHNQSGYYWIKSCEMIKKVIAVAYRCSTYCTIDNCSSSLHGYHIIYTILFMVYSGTAWYSFEFTH